MELEQVREFVAQADRDTIWNIIDVIMCRSRQLYPDEEMVVAMLPKYDEERKRLLPIMMGLLENEKFDKATDRAK